MQHSILQFVSCSTLTDFPSSADKTFQTTAAVTLHPRRLACKRLPGWGPREGSIGEL
jgi:hypothetical protein